MKTEWVEIAKYIRDNAIKIDSSQGVIGKNPDGTNIWDEWDYYETTARISKMFNLDMPEDLDILFKVMNKYTWAAY